MILHHDVWLDATRRFDIGLRPQKLLSPELKRAAGVAELPDSVNEMPSHISPDFKNVWVRFQKKPGSGRLLIPP